MSDERPLLDTVLEMTADSVKRADLDDRDLMMVRLTALAAVNAPPGSYLLNLAAAANTSLTAEDVRGALDRCRPDHRHTQGRVGRQRDRHCARHGDRA